jgi:hypothetical protein
MKTAALATAAKNLDSYVRYRAGREGVGYSLSEKFFREALRGGVRSFFRIAVGEDGSLISDDQFPEWFKEWKRPN